MKSQDAWRRVVGMSIAAGVPVPGFTASLSYFDTYRRERLPANLVQVGLVVTLDLANYGNSGFRLRNPVSKHTAGQACLPASLVWCAQGAA